jgi:hypothetical protein
MSTLVEWTLPVLLVVWAGPVTSGPDGLAPVCATGADGVDAEAEAAADVADGVTVGVADWELDLVLWVGTTGLRMGFTQ